MAKNLFEVVQALLIPSVLLAMVAACVVRFDAERFKLWFLKSLAGICVVVLIVSFLRERRLIKYNQINNLYLLCASLILGLAFCVMDWLYSVRQQKLPFAYKIAMMATGLLFVTCHLLYRVPVIFDLPFHFVGMYDTYFSTSFLAKCTGYLLALIICLLSFLAVYKVLSRNPEKVNAACFTAMYLVSGFISFVGIIGIINSYYRRKIKIPTGLRKALPQLIQAENIIFFVAILILVLLAVSFFVYYTRIHGEYSNPAEHRKLKAFARSVRRWSLFVIALCVFAWVDMTAIKRIANRIVELSPSEDYQIDGNVISIPLEQIADGHLHRFTWENDAGKGIRFIVVQKKGMSFGVGFDACDVCGDVGYYERKDEVVCNRCDVVMNKSTIGLKGGCNPVPLYSYIENGALIVLTDDLQKEAHRFKN